MKASATPRQLSIRSDDAYERAHRLARRRQTSVTAVIEQALQQYERDIASDVSPAMAEENRRILDEMLVRIWGSEGPPRDLSSDHSWMYDENGLPK